MSKHRPWEYGKFIFPALMRDETFSCMHRFGNRGVASVRTWTICCLPRVSLLILLLPKYTRIRYKCYRELHLVRHWLGHVWRSADLLFWQLFCYLALLEYRRYYSRTTSTGWYLRNKLRVLVDEQGMQIERIRARTETAQSINSLYAH